jgi:hypothetical protein
MLIVNRVHVQVFIVEHDSQKNRKENDESSSTLSSMKKNRQSSSKSKTANEMNIENDLIRNENSRSTASHAYVNLIVRTRIFVDKRICVCDTNESFSNKIQIKIVRDQKTAREIQKKRFVSLSKKQKILFREK